MDIETIPFSIISVGQTLISILLICLRYFLKSKHGTCTLCSHFHPEERCVCVVSYKQSFKPQLNCTTCNHKCHKLDQQLKACSFQIPESIIGYKEQRDSYEEDEYYSSEEEGVSTLETHHVDYGTTSSYTQLVADFNGSAWVERYAPCYSVSSHTNHYSTKTFTFGDKKPITKKRKVLKFRTIKIPVYSYKACVCTLCQCDECTNISFCGCGLCKCRWCRLKSKLEKVDYLVNKLWIPLHITNAIMWGVFLIVMKNSLNRQVVAYVAVYLNIAYHVALVTFYLTVWVVLKCCRPDDVITQ